MLVKLLSLYQQNKTTMKYSELEKQLKKLGCEFLRNGKKHPIWLNPRTGVTFELSNHGSEEVAKGTLNKILKIARG